MNHLNDRVAIVTGAGRGIGREHALALGRAGAKVVVNDYGSSWDGAGQDNSPAQQVVDEIREAGGEAVPNFDDVANWDGGAHLVQAALDTFGQLDALVCNAGFVRDRMLFNMTEDEWDSVVRVHLKGHFIPTRAAARYWRERAKTSGQPVDASIVFTTSASGLYANVGQFNYDAAKAGIASMTIAAARELESYGVRVNAICPSARTRMTEQSFDVDPRGDAEGGSFDPLSPANISPSVVWLCSPASSRVSGQVLEVRGGTVFLLQGWTRMGTIHKDGPWTVDELDEAAQDLFGEGGSWIPPLPKFDVG